MLYTEDAGHENMHKQFEIEVCTCKIKITK